jgi:YidC/Oxa1 family membrane protein insertase
VRESLGEAFDVLVNALQWLLQALYGFGGSYLIAIVLLTVIIRAVLHPLTRKQLGSMKAMQALAPQMQVLRRKYKDNMRQFNVEVMNLYRANKVNPFGGCLPLLLQLPVLYALFALLRRPKVFGGETLFGFPLEAAPTFEVLLQHPALILVPVLTGLTTYLQQRLSITDPQQAQMFIIMPFFLAYTSVAGWFPLGLSVYWVVSTAVYLVEYYAVVGPPKPVTEAPPKQRRHQARRGTEGEGK